MNIISAWKKSTGILGLVLGLILTLPGLTQAQDPANHWTACGWGGGGFFYCAAYHPTKDGVIYMGGDVCGVAKSEDNGKTWRMINNGIADYGIFTLAVDPSNPDTVYAATEGGLCKSVNAGEKWELLPQTARKELHITGEKGKSVRCVAVDPTDGNVVYAGTPLGKVYKSIDGGQTWTVAYTKAAEAGDAGLLRVQYGKVDGNYFGDLWMPLKFPNGAKPESCTGIGFEFKGDGTTPKDCFLILKTSAGLSYRSKNLNEMFQNTTQQDVVLKPEDFVLDPDFAAKNPDKVATVPATPDWATVNRFDLSCSGNLPVDSSVGKFGKMFYMIDSAKVTLVDFATEQGLQHIANIRLGAAQGGPIFSVAVSAKNHAWVLAGTQDSGVLFSQDSGATWKPLQTPKRATSVVFDPSDPKVMYGTFGSDGIWKSIDEGETWVQLGDFGKSYSATEVQVSTANPQDVYLVGNQNFWNGVFSVSNDGGKTWKKTSKMTVDKNADPTLQGPSLSGLTNVTVNPLHPGQIFLSANWRPAFSEDNGLTWTERDKGADISCIADIRFHGPHTYTSVMDEGTLASDDGGQSWRQLWPLVFDAKVSGHDWRLAITDNGGVDHIIATDSPWTDDINNVIVSDDSGKTFKVSSQGLPAKRPKINTMWGNGYARALSVDPNNPKIVYLGIDGDASAGQGGGGVFKSEDGGMTWTQLANQPDSRRMFFGLMVDPSNSQRIYWAACGDKGGLYLSEDGGNSWKRIFQNETWLFNLLVTADGTVYTGNTNLWRSTDQGKTWTQLTHFTKNQCLIGLETNTKDPKTIWLSMTTWDGSSNGGIYKTSDGGTTWNEITGDIPFVKPMVLRYNPETQELWAGGVGLFKIKQ